MSMTHDEMIAVIAAHKDGKQLEYKSISDTNWKLATTPVFNFDIADYRIKPEPIVLWGVYEARINLRTYTTKEAAESYASKLSYRTTIKKFVEAES